MNEQEHCDYLIKLYFEKVEDMQLAIECALLCVSTILNEIQVLSYVSDQITYWKEVYKLLKNEFRTITENS
jgi:hypothetical protein